MNQDEKKATVAAAALDYIENGQIVGIGSGTTALAATKSKRNFIGIENNEEYVKIAQTRTREYNG